MIHPHILESEKPTDEKKDPTSDDEPDQITLVQQCKCQTKSEEGQPSSLPLETMFCNCYARICHKECCSAVESIT